MAAKRVDFQRELESMFLRARRQNQRSITVSAGDLHRIVGDYPGADHRMPVCCSVMRQVMRDSDEVLESPLKGNGASLRIRYQIPRSKIVGEQGDMLPAVSVNDANFQRIGAVSNTQVGKDFEKAASQVFARQDIQVQPDFSVPVGIGRLRKKHCFDLGSSNPPILVECKSHRWTTGGNTPSAKLTVWNEAMYYFAVAPLGFRKVLFVLRDHSESRGLTLAEHYVSRYLHLIPEDVEIWEFDEETGAVSVMDLQSLRNSSH
ncbi:hypothetical protein CLV44_11976 [Marinobacterium halophilum]|uniref:Uncharacterized protein n=1 Tax=Marinobacterium halophilum TaxID=267374 RepID=A0A2P8ERY1_9GAMM|nr:hypothetical protein [Marinobacterium halophilum]PSL12241.1 hypothetical protein CLV44_11976 [Marinobacterium halophilum]